MRKPRALQPRMLFHSAPVEVRVWLVRVRLHFRRHLSRRRHRRRHRRRQHPQVCPRQWHLLLRP